MPDAARNVRLILAARNADALVNLANELDATAVPVDARSFQAVDDLVDKKAGDIDAAVNCAGSILLKPAHLTTEDELRETIEVNIMTAFALVRSCSKVMRKNGGSIVLISSCAAGLGLANHEAIAAAKAGIEGLVRSAAATYAPNNIRINAVAPGLVDTPLSRSITSNPNALHASKAMHPLGRIGSADEIAEMIEFLIDPATASSWMTGQVIQVDGGLANVRARSRAS